MKSIVYKFLAGVILTVIFSTVSVAQGVPQGINYQGIAADANGLPVSNKTIGIRISIYSGASNGLLQWEETHSSFANQFGLFSLIIGQGVSTGNGVAAAFADIKWENADHYLKIALDITGGSNYIDMNNSRLLAVPYSFYSAKSGALASPVSVSDLTDVDTTGIGIAKLLKWNGTKWIIAKDNDSDTAKYAISANTAFLADTALYLKNIPVSDTAKFAFKADSSAYSTTAYNAVNATHSDYSDTASYALNCAATNTDWHLTGNATIGATQFIGTLNNADLIMKTNNNERMRITSSGKVGIGITNPLAAVHVVGDDGMIVQGTFGSGTVLNPGAGTRMMWYPKKAAFRAGYVTATQWDDANIGNYSIANGYASTAKGHGAVALGRLCLASDSCGVAMGYAATASGKYSIAMGNAPNAGGVGAVAIGRGANAGGYAAQAIGYHVTASGNYSTAFGDYTVTSGEHSVAMGYHANTNGMRGSFVYSDYSSTSIFAAATAPNQFMVKAAGGTIFYSNSVLSSGVSLAPGGGAWLTLSDKNSKENFKKMNKETILHKIAGLDIPSWNYKSQNERIRHLGPMAQDFYAAFGLGENNTTITTTDIDGINMLAIQALTDRTKELSEKIAELNQMKKRLQDLEKQKQALERRLITLEEKLLK